MSDAWLEREANTLQRMQLRSVLQAALEALEDNDAAGAELIRGDQDA